MQDLELEIRLYNNQIKERRTGLGMSQGRLAKSCGTNKSYVGLLESMKLSPKCKDGTWRKAALDIAAFFGVEPEEMFPPFTEIADALERPKAKVSADELGRRLKMLETPCLEAPSLPDELFERDALKQTIIGVLETLTPREELVIRHRFGIDHKEKKLEEIGTVIGVQRERVRQIEAKALRKLRHPTRSKHLRGTSTMAIPDELSLSRYIIIDRRFRVVDGKPATTPLYYLVKEHIYREVTWARFDGINKIDKYLVGRLEDPTDIEVFRTEWDIKNEIRVQGYEHVDTFDTGPFLPVPADIEEPILDTEVRVQDRQKSQHLVLVPFMETEFYRGKK